MPGKLYNQLFDVATDQHGYVTTDDARSLGIPADRLRVMASRDVLERVGYGVYRFPDVPGTSLDQYMEAVLWARGPAALSHATALDLHDLGDVNPAKIHLTVPTDFRTTRAPKDMYVLHRRDLAADDLTYHDGIPIVTPRRAILDGIEQHLGGHLIDQAIAAARRRGLVRPADLAEIRRARSALIAEIERARGAPVTDP